MRSLIEDEPTVDDLEDITALGLLQRIYQCRSVSLHIRMRAAISALPMESPRLAVTAQITDNDVATILDRRIAHYNSLKLLEAPTIEATPTNGQVDQPHTSIAPTPPETNGNAQPQPAPLSRLYSNKRFPRRF